MRRLAGLALFFFSLPASFAFILPPNVSSVNLKRYSGSWYEIASIPLRIQRGCACTQANYSLTEKGTINITNACWRNGWPSVARGKAWSISKDNHELKVQFFWPFKGSYKILYVDSDYQYAVVGTKSHSHLWILARKPVIPQKTLDALLDLASSHGYASNKIRQSAQACSWRLRELLTAE